MRGQREVLHFQLYIILTPFESFIQPAFDIIKHLAPTDSRGVQRILAYLGANFLSAPPNFSLLVGRLGKFSRVLCAEKVNVPGIIEH